MVGITLEVIYFFVFNAAISFACASIFVFNALIASISGATRFPYSTDLYHSLLVWTISGNTFSTS
ncbi:MAG: hypothetical protein WCH65_00715 [bacterium]